MLCRGSHVCWMRVCSLVDTTLPYFRKKAAGRSSSLQIYRDESEICFLEENNWRQVWELPWIGIPSASPFVPRSRLSPPLDSSSFFPIPPLATWGGSVPVPVFARPCTSSTSSALNLIWGKLLYIFILCIFWKLLKPSGKSGVAPLLKKKIKSVNSSNIIKKTHLK